MKRYIGRRIAAVLGITILLVSMISQLTFAQFSPTKDIPNWAKDIVKISDDKNKVTIDIPWVIMGEDLSVVLEDYEFKEVAGDLHFKGTIKEDVLLAGQKSPFTPKGEISVIGILRKDLKESTFTLSGNFGVNVANQNVDGVVVKDINTVNASIKLDKKGLLLRGEYKMEDGGSFYAGAEFDDKAEVEAFFTNSLSDWYVKMDASESEEFHLFGASLKAEGSDAAMRISPKGIDVKALFYTGKSHIKIEGKIDSKGIHITGDADVTLPLHLAGHVVDEVTDGAICGYEIVKDGAKCGYKTITSAAKCGTEEIESATKCGTETITSAAKCGEETIKSAIRCGTHTIKNGAKCGYETISCWVQPWKWGKCKEPKSCKVANSCKVAKSCDVALSCKVPKSCKDYNSPKSCQDLSKPKTCQRHHLGDYVGDLKGDIKLKLDRKGLNVSADAKYCPKTGCYTIAAEASYHAKPTMQICFDVKALHGFESAEGKACTEF